jgi:hypothetical protein
VTAFLDELLAELAPLAYDDEAQDGALTAYLEAASEPFEEVEALARDTDAGPGWSFLMDPAVTPVKALPWLAQLVGVARVDQQPGEIDADYRARYSALIAARVGFERGTRAAIIAALSSELTGSKTIVFRERDGSAYHLRIRTLADETPDATRARAAILSQKPAGITLSYAASTGQTFDELNAGFASFGAVKAAYDDFDSVKANI